MKNWEPVQVESDGEGGLSIDGSYFNDCGESLEEMQAIADAANNVQSLKWDDIEPIIFKPQ